MKKHYLLGIAVFFLFLINGNAQNQLHYGMYMMHHPFFNLAAGASYENLTAAALYKTQWTGYDGAPTIGAFNIIKPLGTSTIGLTVNNDQIGIDNNTEISGSYAYKLRLRGYSRLAFGLSASVKLLQSDLSGVDILDANDPAYTGGNTSLIPQPNFKFGTYYFNHRFYAGLAIPNILENKIALEGANGVTGFDMNAVHYYFHSGYKFILNPKSDINVSTLVKQVSGASMQFDLNAKYEYNEKFGLGLSYRSSNEILGIVSVQVLPELKAAYAYEYNMGEIGNYSSGSNEIMLIYQFNPPKESVVSIPRF